MNKIIKIYNILLKSCGKQGWWPLTLDGEIKTRHHAGGPKNNRHRFEIIVGAILTQNTSWKNVEKALESLSKNNLISIEKIKEINKNKLAKLIRSAGYYNQKAERLKIMAGFLSENPIEKLDRLSIGELRKKLLEIKGVGPETADSIILYAFGKPVFVVDAYTKRIFERLGYKEKTYDGLQKLFMKNLPADPAVFNEYHALLVELGKRHCRKKPDCRECPIKIYCEYKE